MQTAARGGGKTGDFLSEHAMIEFRVAAVQGPACQLLWWSRPTSDKNGSMKNGPMNWTGRSYQLEPLPRPTPKACPQLACTFKAVRRRAFETLQLLDRASVVLLAFLPLRQVCETLQLLDRAELRGVVAAPFASRGSSPPPPSPARAFRDPFLQALSKRGSSSRGGTTSHLLSLQALLPSPRRCCSAAQQCPAIPAVDTRLLTR